MRATGIIRRVDELGRVVIPKEVRRICHIKAGDPLELYIDYEKEAVILCKYIVNEVKELFDNLYNELCGEYDLSDERDQAIIADFKKLYTKYQQIHEED